MLLLLPPSEGKTPAPDDALPCDLAELSSPELTGDRLAVRKALIRASARRNAATVLGVSPGLSDEVRRNVDLDTAPAARADRVYSGVLYAAAGLAHLDPQATARAAHEVRIISALWGAVSPTDRIPAYRLAMGVNLPGIGPLAAHWRPRLAAVLGPLAAQDVIVDCRSAPYVAAWRPPAGSAWVTVRVLRDIDGRRTVVSHHAKHTRGLLVRHLLTCPADLTTTESIAEAAWNVVGTEVLDAALRPATGRGPAVLELVVT